MKSVGDILKELGFNAEASLDTQKAFFKHLAQQAEPKLLKQEEKPKTKLKKTNYEQLEFAIEAQEPIRRRVS